MKIIYKTALLLTILIAIFGIYTFVLFNNQTNKNEQFSQSSIDIKHKKPINQKILQNDYHVFQSFNNCAPAALSMLLSYFDIHKNQEELADELRPFHNRTGINDDKSTTPDELAEKAKEYGLIPYYRVNGSIELLKQFIDNDIPILMRTLLSIDKEFPHYRVIKGYDDNSKEIIQDDSYEGKNLRFLYDDYLKLWQEFNYEYLVLVRPEQQTTVKTILGKEFDSRVAWSNAKQRAIEELTTNPNDIRARFNLSISLYELGEYKLGVE
ncbi:MAG: C39 family peptidase, partial [Patescibacteria group bacterium]